MINFLKSRGFFMVREGTHCVLRDGRGRTVSVPNHAQIAKGTHYQILRSALDPS
ncbi:type II toxin-antitoxin system HicA family toxin [Streptomyces uncialis]|uniref:type II toxin-antitoxin system HicA family toxin n=1 Tax=Streptomyces uncialis TaxID=1048205 RepID=UPI0037FB1262